MVSSLKVFAWSTEMAPFGLSLGGGRHQKTRRVGRGNLRGAPAVVNRVSYCRRDIEDAIGRSQGKDAFL